MITEKGKRELTPKDQKVLNTIIEKSPDTLTAGERGHLVARRDYLDEATLKEYGIEGAEEVAPEEEVQDEINVNEYETLKKDELIKEAGKRDIGLDGKETKADIVELLELDDKGELDEQ